LDNGVDDLDENATSRRLLDQSSSSLNYVMFLSGDSETKKLRSHLVFTALAHIPWWLKVRVMYRSMQVPTPQCSHCSHVRHSGRHSFTWGSENIYYAAHPVRPYLRDASERGQNERFVIQVEQGSLGKQR